MAELLQTFLRIKQVTGLVGLSTSTIYARMKEGTFPRPVPIGSRAVAWPASTIASWQAEQIERNQNPDISTARTHRPTADAACTPGVAP